MVCIIVMRMVLAWLTMMKSILKELEIEKAM